MAGNDNEQKATTAKAQAAVAAAAGDDADAKPATDVDDDSEKSREHLGQLGSVVRVDVTRGALRSQPLVACDLADHLRETQPREARSEARGERRSRRCSEQA